MMIDIRRVNENFSYGACTLAQRNPPAITTRQYPPPHGTFLPIFQLTKGEEIGQADMRARWVRVFDDVGALWWIGFPSWSKTNAVWIKLCCPGVGHVSV